jgi:hypothetical protein
MATRDGAAPPGDKENLSFGQSLGRGCLGIFLLNILGTVGLLVVGGVLGILNSSGTVVLLDVVIMAGLLGLLFGLSARYGRFRFNWYGVATAVAIYILIQLPLLLGLVVQPTCCSHP